MSIEVIILKKVLIIIACVIFIVLAFVLTYMNHIYKIANDYYNEDLEKVTSNGGIAVQQGDWIYYKNGLPNTKSWFNRFEDKGKLFKIKVDGTQKSKICNDNAENINISGYNLFYAVSKDLNSTKLGYDIFRIELKNFSRRYISHTSSKEYIISDEWIYYIDSSCIYKVKTDGSNKICLVDIGNGFIEEIQLSEGWIFFTDDSQNNKIFKVNINGGEKFKINDESSGHIKVVGNWIYYSDSLTNSKVYKIQKDGTNRLEVNNEEAKNEYYCDKENIVGDLLYDVTGNGLDNCRIFRSKIDSSEKSKLSDDNVDYFTGIDIVGDWIYYINESDMNNIYKIKLDGTNRTKVGS